MIHDLDAAKEPGNCDRKYSYLFMEVFLAGGEISLLPVVAAFNLDERICCVCWSKLTEARMDPASTFSL